MNRLSGRLLVLVATMLLTTAVWPMTASAQSLHQRRHDCMVSSQAGVRWTTVSSSGRAVELIPHPEWPSLPRATWIWRTPTDENELVTFTQAFKVRKSRGPVAATLSITSDNAYQVFLNEKLVGSNGPFSFDGPDEATWATIFEHHLTPRRGRNLLEIRALNYFGPPEPDNNPAGLIYRLDIHSRGCANG